MKTARAAIGLVILVLIAVATVAVLVTEGVKAAALPSLALIAGCSGMYALVRHPPKPKPSDRMRLIVSLALVVPLTFSLLVVLLPLVWRTGDWTIRVAALLSIGVVLAGVALTTGIEWQQHQASRNTDRLADPE